ncbi:hypothetical protein WCLP8_90002 [uncultured Gammaproteobacteria bacterium]
MQVHDELVLGLRSLIDVLSGETTLINAQSDAASAVADVAIAAFTLLKDWDARFRYLEIALPSFALN